MTRLAPTALLRHGLRFLIPLSIALTVYLYLYPVFNTCGFPLPPDPTGPSILADTGRAAFFETAKVHWHTAAGTAENPTVLVPSRAPAPFRLLALGDPQLEGDTSIPTDYLGVFPHAKKLFRHVTFKSSHPSLRQRMRQSFHELVDVVFEDTYHALESLRKRIDLVGNDLYLAHIYRTVRWWSRPTHVTVLGDLLGSQWIDDNEFYRRAGRFWNRVFRGAERVPDDIAAYPAEEYDLAGSLGGGPFNESTAWVRRLINVAGNHDIGYAGDINDERTERFERAFGKLNYELRFELPLTNASLAETTFDADPSSTRLVPELRIVVLNDMNLDTPVISTKLQDDTYAFINKVISTAAAVEFRGHFTVLLTHIPLYKPEGVCVDDPFFSFHDHDGSLREQNQLSAPASKGFLEGILGMSGNIRAAGRGRGRPGIILNGHDHEGCDTWHYINQSVADPQQRAWEVKRWRQAKTAGVVGHDGIPGVREVTVRSMMGGFGGNAGLLSAWFDEDSWEWRTEYTTCPLGTQHLWWLVHILDLIVVVGIVLLAIATLLSALRFNVDKTVEESVTRLYTPQRKLGRPSTPVKGAEAAVKSGGSG
ncbi:hypothetical protein P885DRAFT_39606 [Corynascus similis CBS 632.67]